MLQEIIELQSRAVNGILNELLIKDNIIFKSPTGSGKTYMMADLMNKVLQNEKDIIFLVSSLSKGDLAKQNYDKFKEYSDKRMFLNIKPHLISSETVSESRLHIPTDYNTYVLPRDLYKDKSKLKKESALVNFLRAVTAPKPLGLGKKIYIIKDECHIATTNLDDLSNEYFTKTINCSATPNLNRGQKPDIEIKEIDAINAKLIKSVSYQEGENLDIALAKFKEIKKKYNDILGINPCLIIQISNQEKADEEIYNIKHSLNKYNDLKWMLIVNDDKLCDTNDVFKAKKVPVKKWKDYAKKNTATIDIIIFKMVITEGWDIPRACMLFQIRDSKSKQLDEQVVGRVRRNPCLLNYENLKSEAKELVNTAYVWGLAPKDSKNIREVKLVGTETNNEVHCEIKLKTTRLKRPLQSNSFNINTHLTRIKNKATTSDIFSLYKKYSNANKEVRELFNNYVVDIPKWFHFMENIDSIANESKNILCNYSQNMEVVKDNNGNEIEVSFPFVSYYTDSANQKSIKNWLWRRTDGEDVFSFDSESEKEWAEILVGLVSEDSPIGSGRVIKNVKVNYSNNGNQQFEKKYLLGKNFLSNSEIKYEYYLNGIHYSYPDFILKDYEDKIHIFESKSLNKAKDSNIDGDEYEAKVIALKEAYLHASKLTGHYFYIPIKDDDSWKIYQYINGVEKLLSLERFLNFIKGNNI